MFFNPKLYKDCGKLFIILEHQKGFEKQSHFQPVKKIFWKLYIKDGVSLWDWENNFKQV